MGSAQQNSHFEIVHEMIDGRNMVTFTPVKFLVFSGYPPKQIEFTQEQWDALQYHFAKMVNDKTGISKLAYIF